MYSINMIANYLLTKEEMIHKKLQKLCYYIQAYYLAIHNERLINTNFEAWIHGAVSRQLYDKYCNFGSSLIPKTINDTNIKNKDKIFIDIIYNIYGKYTGNQLETLMCTERPWLNAREGYGVWDSCTVTIKDEDMMEFYKSKLKCHKMRLSRK